MLDMSWMRTTASYLQKGCRVSHVVGSNEGKTAAHAGNHVSMADLAAMCNQVSLLGGMAGPIRLHWMQE